MKKKLSLFFFSTLFITKVLCTTIQFEKLESSGSETVTNVIITVVLSQISIQPISVDYATTGGIAYAINEGTGQDYIPSYGKLTFYPGETAKNISLVIIDDNITEADETIELTLSNPVNASLGPNWQHIYTIIDNDRKLLLDVKNLPIYVSTVSAKGDGITIDDFPVQKAIDYAWEQVKTSSQGAVIFFPQGTYIIKSIKTRTNMTFQGYDAIIKRPDHIETLIGQNQARWLTTFNYYIYSGPTESKPVIVKGITFDGNSMNQGPYEKYQLEHAALMYFYSSTPTYQVNAFVEDCLFKNGVGDGVGAIRNVNLTIYNCTADNIFRVGFSCEGDNDRNLKLNYKNLTCRNGSSVHGESYGDDYGTKPSLFLFDDFDLMDGTFSLGAEIGVTLYASNIFTGSTFWLFGGSMTFTNCKFSLPDKQSRLFGSRKNNFTNCEFYYTKNNNSSEQDNEKYFCIYSYGFPNGRTFFDNCWFRTDASINNDDTVIGIYIQKEDGFKNNIIHFNQCDIRGKFDIGFNLSGSSTIIRDSYVEAHDALKFQGYKSQYGYKFYCATDISGLLVSTNCNRYIYLLANDTNNVIVQNLIIDQSPNIIGSYYSNISSNNFSGYRVIIGSLPPTCNTHGFVGDIYRLANPIPGQEHEWRCIKEGFNTKLSSWFALPTINVIATITTPTPNPSDEPSAIFYVGGIGVTHYRYDFDCSGFSSTKPVSSPIILNNLANGGHYLSVVGRNASGEWQPLNRATSYWWLVMVDTLPPAGLVRINKGDNIASTTTVTLKFEASDRSGVIEMKVSNINDFDNTPSEPYTKTKTWNLLSGSGNKVVYAWFKDAKGNWTEKNNPAKDMIYVISKSTVNHIPELTNIGYKKINENEFISFTVSATDLDNDPLTFYATNLPPEAVFDNQSNTFRWLPPKGLLGDFMPRIYASDGKSEDWEDVVININRPPEIEPITEKVFVENKLSEFSVTNKDLDLRDELSIWMGNNPKSAQYSLPKLLRFGVTIGSYTVYYGSFSWTPNIGDAGDYYITFFASDTRLGTSSVAHIIVSPDESEPPSVPQNLTCLSVLPHCISLTWSASTDNFRVYGYNIYRNSVKINTSTSTKYDDETVTSTTTYTYQVSAYDPLINESEKSNQVTATTPLNTNPNLIIISPKPNEVIYGIYPIVASVNDDYGLDKIIFYVNQLTQSTITISGTTAQITYNLNTTLLKDSTHQIRVVVYDKSKATDEKSVVVRVKNIRDLNRVFVSPNPINFKKAHSNKIKFYNLTINSTIRIYTIDGQLVKTIKPGSQENDGISGEANWDGKDEGGCQVAPGIYIYLITDEENHKKSGKIAVTK